MNDDLGMPPPLDERSRMFLRVYLDDEQLQSEVEERLWRRIEASSHPVVTVTAAPKHRWVWAGVALAAVVMVFVVVRETLWGLSKSVPEGRSNEAVRVHDRAGPNGQWSQSKSRNRIPKTAAGYGTGGDASAPEILSHEVLGNNELDRAMMVPEVPSVKTDSTPANRGRKEKARPVERTPPAGGDAGDASHGDGGLVEEIELLQQARRALGRGDLKLCLSLLGRHASRYPDGTLAEERDALRAIASCGGASDDRRAETAAGFERRHAGSLFLGRVRDACAAR